MNRKVSKATPAGSGVGNLGLFRKRVPARGNIAAGISVTRAKSSAYHKRVGIGYLMLLVLILVIASSAFVYHLQVRFDGVRLGYEASRARAIQTRLLLERRELRLELASLKSPGKVETDARERLSMEVPDHKRIITVGKKRRQVSVSGGAL